MGILHASLSFILLSNHTKDIYYPYFKVEETESTQLCLLPDTVFISRPMPLNIKVLLSQKKKNTFGLVKAQQTRWQLGGEEFKLYFVEDTKLKYTDLIGE